ncbi:MAG TPA: bifunctional hydroxymethylpyrimidine kinase/phosphomethylpyrimidine kinase [Pyrinomonadaceae bacterium]|nr:bifunctional hydroxymethylpyrimidine kinase/phosphomethylpyrimidine kinase [Pyrinomonadaceae bacterium]HMP66451.1 bifunctional hydroxymethylpyrimidine kinase/phosphomethylpyrimidine kinase [Pyrinomonadaceae bacterium]
MERKPVCLTIAGLDPSGGAGIIADLRTFGAFGCYPTAAVTSLTFQNTRGVFGAENQSAATLRGQVEPVLKDLDVVAVKTGMLPSKQCIDEVAELVEEFNIGTLVVDPVVRSTSGFDLVDDAAVRALVERLFPIASIVTPNMAEAEKITGIAIDSEDDVIDAAEIMQSQGARSVLIKGGHLRTIAPDRIARDHLFIFGEREDIDGEYHQTTDTHGSGCTLAAAITANLALGHELSASVKIAKAFVNDAIRTAVKIGHGNSPVNIPAIWRPE